MASLDIKPDFAIFDLLPNLVYLDSASTALVPKTVTKAVTSFLNNTVASARRGAHKLATRGSTIVEEARDSIALFMGTKSSQISFQKSIPSAVASLALGYDWKGQGKNKIVVAESEEHNVLVSLLRVAQLLNLEVASIPIDSEGHLALTDLNDVIDEKTGIVAVSRVTVGTGIKNPIENIGQQAHNNDAILLSDITQSISFEKTTPNQLNADVLVFSANIGLMAPPGFAVQWIEKGLGAEIIPGILGGSSVTNVEGTTFDIALQPDKYESGTINVPGIAGVSPAIDYLTGLHTKNLKGHLRHLSSYLLDRLDEIPNLTIYGSPSLENTIFALNVGSEGNISCHDVALFLDESGIAVRSGLLCAHPLVKHISQEGVIQISLHAYNTSEDIDSFVNVLKVIATDLT